MANESETLGTLVRTSDGKLYFISEETLARCEVTDDAAASTLAETLDGIGERTGFSFRPGFEIAYASVDHESVKRGGFKGAEFTVIPDDRFSFERTVAVW